MTNPPPSVQATTRAGFIELNWGQPDPALLPVEHLRRATTLMLDHAGADALSYGAETGPGPLLAWLRDRIERAEGRAIATDEIIITGGNSDALDQICTLFTQPGDVAIVESPTYHLAVRIMRDHPLEIVTAPVDEDGLRVDGLKTVVADLKRNGRRPRLLYIIPTFHNPTGVNLSLERRKALVALAAQEGFFIVEDDVYRELAYDGAAPPSLWSLAPSGTVMRMGSFAKSLAPGMRVGYLTSDAKAIQRFALSGLRDSAGGTSHFAAMVTASFCEAGFFDKQVAYLKAAYRARRDALLDGLAEFMPPGVKWTRPGGGFFVWVTLPEGMDAASLLPRAEAEGMTFIPGTKFCIDGAGRNQLRLAFSYYRPENLVEGVRRLGQVLRQT